MLATQTIDSDDPWHEANNQNKAAKPRSITNSFDAEITKQSRRGFEYNPLTFREQWHFLKSMFYKVPQGTQLQIKRRYGGERQTTFSQPQRFITLCYACSAMNCTLAFRSGQYTTSRQPQVPDITPQQMIHSLLWKALSFAMLTRHPATRHMEVQPVKGHLNGRNTWIGLCPVTKPAPQRRVKHCSSRYSSRHS